MSEISKIIAIGSDEEGYLEKASNAQLDDKTANAGSGNFTKYWRDMCPQFQGQAWCNCFVNWIFMKAHGVERAKSLLCTDGDWSYYTPTSAQFFKDKNQWYTTPKLGDIVFFKNTQRIHHVGFVYKVSSTDIYTIEGNTSKGEQVIPNGGGVFKKQYKINNPNIAGYGRPKYRLPSTREDIEDEIVQSDRKGLKILANTLNIRKYPCGGAEVLGTYKKGQRVQITAKARDMNSNVWFKTVDGYINGGWVEGWVKEANGRWWYVMEDYTYPLHTVYTIDGKDYIFDNQGWMITPDRVAASGEIKY